MSPKRFLVVAEKNDPASLSEILRRGLLREGFTVDCAHNQSDALHLAATIAPPDVVFLDNDLPGLDSNRFKNKLHHVAPNARILLINSGSGNC